MNSLKKLKNWFVVIPALWMCACADLDLPSDGRITYQDLFSKRGQIIGYYYTCVAIPGIGFGYSNSPLASFCDEAHDASDMTAGAVYNWYNDRLTPAYNPLGSVWAAYYTLIGKCNTFITGMTDPDIRYKFENPDEKEGLIARVRVARAYYYLQLIKRYGGVPIVDTPYGYDHDFSKDRRSSFEEVADFIIAECDLALAVRETEGSPVGFRWAISDDERGMVTRAFAYAVKSQTALFAASPLWFTTGSKYTWEKATVITKEALDQCLAHGFQLYDTPVDPNVAQNPYAYYFITRSDGSRSWDKETIYESSWYSPVWQQAGLPITAGMSKAGAGPSQELVDSYEMQATGEPPILGYMDANHLLPVANPASDYNPNNPYAGRDPRFDASIYYNGSNKNLGIYIELPWELMLDAHLGVNGLDFTDHGDYYEFERTEGDPFFWIGVPTDVRGGARSYITFEYQVNTAITAGVFSFWDAMWGNISAWIGAPAYEATGIDPDNETLWKTYTFDMAGATANGWSSGFVRIDPNTTAGNRLLIRNMKVIRQLAPTIVETFVGGNCGISDAVTDTRFTRTGYYMRKFNDYRSNNTLNADGYMRIFRLAELYLNFAEAACQSAASPDAPVASTVGGNALSARDAVNAVRKRAAMPDFPAGMTKEAFETKYRNERRVELAFEEHRFYDVRRWKILHRTDGFVTGMRITREGTDLTYTRIKLADRKTNTDQYLILPIDAAEAQKMELLTGENWQNPGW